MRQAACVVTSVCLTSHWITGKLVIKSYGIVGLIARLHSDLPCTCSVVCSGITGR